MAGLVGLLFLLHSNTNMYPFLANSCFWSPPFPKNEPVAGGETEATLHLCYRKCKYTYSIKKYLQQCTTRTTHKCLPQPPRSAEPDFRTWTNMAHQLWGWQVSVCQRHSLHADHDIASNRWITFFARSLISNNRVRRVHPRRHEKKGVVVRTYNSNRTRYLRSYCCCTYSSTTVLTCANAMGFFSPQQATRSRRL